MRTSTPPANFTAEISLRTVALVFLKLGTIAFGGPAAHIAMMEDEFVTRRQWLTREQFLDRLGAANLIPGPSSTEMAIFIGYERRGWPGLLVAGCSFIFPAAIMVGLIAAAYVRYGTLPQVGGVLYALKPVVIAIVVQAFWKLARSAVKTKWLAAIAIVSGGLYSVRLHELFILGLAAVLAAAPVLYDKAVKLRHFPVISLLPITAVRVFAAFGATAAPVGLL